MKKPFYVFIVGVVVTLAVVTAGCKPAEITRTVTTTSQAIPQISTTTTVYTQTQTLPAQTITTTITQAVVPEPVVPNSVSRDITPAEAYTLIQQNAGNDKFIVLDVRTFEEYYAGHLENAALVDVESEAWFPTLEALNRDYTYLVY
ncbi:MAG: rhodanese-like domain-containing protein [Dehalococcoidaceae bacterium]|nr:rhodanese-like domain-containing protein [Dehalococcoidaceae bacterium]